MDFYGINLTGDMGIDADNSYDIGEVAKRAKIVYAVTFEGESSSAQWGDLAEKYICSESCRVGTVVCISTKEDVDIEPCQEDLASNCIGVISAKPGFLMNKQLKGGEIVGLVGRVPVQMVGPVKKGDFVVATAIGCARAGVKGEEAFKIGIANATKENSKVAIVECIIK